MTNPATRESSDGVKPARFTTPRVALCTSVDWPLLSPDDGLLVSTLARVGVEARIVAWTDEQIAWEQFDLMVVRSCWDYHDDLPRWLAWLDALALRGVDGRLCNPAPALRWNARKTYLTELGARGVPVVPTRWLDSDALASEDALWAALHASPWDDFVCKPAVSAGARGTVHLSRAALSSSAASSRIPLRAALPEWTRRAPLLIQPFMPEILSEGEWSLLFFEGTFSHAVRKFPAAGDFRVQQQHGGTTVAAVPDEALLSVAERVLSVATSVLGLAGPMALLYARVDLVMSAGQPLLIELEIIEPGLFLTCEPAAAFDAGAPESPSDRLCRAIARRAIANANPSSPTWGNEI